MVLPTTDDAEFNGTVIVEWLNVSGGIDAPAVWFMAHREIARAGFAYVAVSAQQVGVEGGDSLVGSDVAESAGPERYSVSHGDGVRIRHLLAGRPAFRVGGPPTVLRPETEAGPGVTKSAFFLTRYVNAVGPFDAV